MTAKIRLIGIVALFLSIAGSASAMSGACYVDRTPGGCFERATAQEKQEEQAKKLRSDFISLMQQTPASAVPEFCGVHPAPQNGYGPMVPEQNLTDAQFQTCIDAGKVWLNQKQAHDQQGAQVAADAYAKASKWKKIVADNGAVYEADVGHIIHYDNGNAEITVYTVEGEKLDPGNRDQFLFNCQGNYQILDRPLPPTQYGAPHSVAGVISTIACAKPPANPKDYCVGFSKDACGRMSSVITSAVKPKYCKSDFALGNSGLSDEQMRICYVMIEQ